MTDNEIIKALEVHSNEKFDNCEGCPYLVGDFCEGFTKHSKPFRDVIDLINRQQAEIERLQLDLEFKCDNCKNIKLSREEYRKAVLQAKSEAITEFSYEIVINILPKLMYEHEEKAAEIAFALVNKVAELTHEPTKIEHNSLCETETYESR